MFGAAKHGKQSPLRLQKFCVVHLEEGINWLLQVFSCYSWQRRCPVFRIDRIQRVVKIFGMVACTEDFCGHPGVINGCSELMKEVFGDDAGVGTRSAVGMSSLPLGVMVEIEAVFELNEE